MSPMSLVYRPLFAVRIRHTFYAEGVSTEDFAVRPTAATAKALADSGFLMRPVPDGLAVYAEVEPDSDPPALRRSLDDDVLHATLVMEPKNPRFLKITELPAYAPRNEIFVFDNLREDVDGPRLLLGDAIADARIGSGVALVTGNVYEHTFPAPADRRRITVTDRFGVVVHELDVAHDEPVTGHRLHLDAIEPLPPGRYRVADDGGGSREIYFDPALRGRAVFGVIEIFNRTEPLDPGDVNRVPAAYRFLDGDELTGVTDYHVQFEALSTTWRYNVVKKYTSGEAEVDELTIAGGPAFTRTLEPDRAVFTSDAALALSEAPVPLTLNRNGDPVRTLPTPGPASQLSEGAAPDTPVSELFVYV